VTKLLMTMVWFGICISILRKAGAWVRRLAARRTHWISDVKLQDATVTLQNNGDNKHVVSCC